MLEGLFVFRAVGDEPVSPWIANAIAEDDIQSEGDFVDEVIHVAFEASIVVTHEEDSLFPVEEEPARELN